MGSRRIGIFLTFVALATAVGCGSDDDDGDSGSAATTEEQSIEAAGEQDAAAKAAARELVTHVETCFVEQQSYAGCENAGEGADLGQATVESATDTSFTIVSPSESGNTFRLEKKKDGSLERICDTPGTGQCGPEGTW